MAGTTGRLLAVVFTITMVVISCCAAQDTSTSIPDTTPSTTTTTTTTTVPPTKLVLNTSDAYASYWVRTILKVPTSTAVNTASFQNEMETELASLYDEAIHRLASILNGTFIYKKRRKRAVTVGNATIQMINISRSDPLEPTHTTFLYYLVEDDPENNITAADRTVGLMEMFSDQEVAIRISYEVVIKAEMYVPLPPIQGKRLWIIGAVIGSVIGAVVIVWCIMFVYFKCTRPPPITPRSPRNPKVADMDPLEYRPTKDVKGFDYVRTEVGMENELDKQKVPDYYRRYPMGSSELEGMYSPGDSPPPPFRGHRPSTGSQQGTQPQKSKTDKIGEEPSYPPPPPPINGFITSNTESQNKAAPKKKTAGKKKRKEQPAQVHAEDPGSALSTEPSESSETTTTANTDQTEQKQVPPQRKGHRRKATSKSSRDSETSEESEQMSKKGTDAAIHPVQEEATSRTKKSDPEKRQRKVHDQPRQKHQEISDPDQPPRRKKKKKKKVTVPAEGIELQPVQTEAPHDNPTAIQPVHSGYNPYRNLPLGTLDTDSSEDNTSIDGISGPQKHAKARQLVNELLNEAFAMVAPPTQIHSEHVSPVHMPSRLPETYTNPPPLDYGGRHVPMYISPVTGKPELPASMWSPYEASDEAAKILSKGQAQPLQYANPAYSNDSIANIQPPGLSPAPDYDDGSFTPYKKPNWNDSLPTAWSDEPATLPSKRRLNDLNAKIPPSSPEKYRITKPSARDRTDDEVDIAADARKTTEPLIASLKEEIQRLASRSQGGSAALKLSS